MVGLLVVPALGCGSHWVRVGSGDAYKTPEEAVADVFNPTSAYELLGRLSAPEPLPFVGDVAFADGPADSVIAVVALALENRALTFQREGDSFVARYRVDIQLQQEGETPIRVSREEAVQVPTYHETLRNKESVLFQQSFHLASDEYTITVDVVDGASPAKSRAQGTYCVPTFTAGSISDPMIVYRVTGRNSPREPLSMLLNPRGAVAYGGDTLLAYIEGYGFLEPTTVPFTVRDEAGQIMYEDSLLFQGAQPLESHLVKVVPEGQTLGELVLAVGEAGHQRTTSALVTYSEAWVLTHYEETLKVLRYLRKDDWVDSLRQAPVERRAETWQAFQVETDPNKATPENEVLEEYFDRVQMTNIVFTNENMPGWRTHRGEIYITLGAPDEIFDRRTESEGRFIYWVYFEYRLEIVFEDSFRFGTYRLTPDSHASYMHTLSRLDRQHDD
jgi:GWxTD domain-containing protein